MCLVLARYPRVLGWDLKTFTNCRFGMMYWAVGIVCYAYKQFAATGSVSDSMAVSVILQLVYITKVGTALASNSSSASPLKHHRRDAAHVLLL